MFTLVFAEILHGFKRLWKLYLTNIAAIVLIILLFAYIDGSRRLLNLQKTAFSGEVIIRMNVDGLDVAKKLNSDIIGLSYVARKIRSNIQFRAPRNDQTGEAELLGVELDVDSKLREYLTLSEGNFPNDYRDILLPDYLKHKAGMRIGDAILVKGYTADDLYNTMPFRICGFYNSPTLSLFSYSRMLVMYKAMEEFMKPHIADVEYCMFFKDGKIPHLINKDIRTAFDDKDRKKVKSIEAVRVSSFDVVDISVQMGIFLNLLIILTIIVVVTVVTLVNFSIYLILFRKQQKRIGTLMSIGVRSWIIGVVLLLESLVQIVISLIVAVIIAFVVSSVARHQLANGFLEIVFILMSGTNKLDFFIQDWHVYTAFLAILSAVGVAQIPIIVKVLYLDPIEVMKTK